MELLFGAGENRILLLPTAPLADYLWVFKTIIFVAITHFSSKRTYLCIVPCQQQNRQVESHPGARDSECFHNYEQSVRHVTVKINMAFRTHGSFLCIFIFVSDVRIYVLQHLIG